MTGVFRRPTRRDWTEAALLVLAVGIFAVPLGVASGLLQLAPDLGAGAWLRVAVAAVFPALSEELVFRGPLAVRRWRTAPAAVLLLAAYVCWHLVGAWLRPDLAHVLADGAFLVIATVLGAACSVSAWRSGSVWPAAVIHWIVVSVWILAFGGLRPKA